MAEMRPALKAVDHISQAAAAFGEIGRVDLGEVAQTHHFGAVAGAGNQGFHLLGREVLRFVDNQKFILKRAPAHKVERFHLDAGAD